MGIELQKVIQKIEEGLDDSISGEIKSFVLGESKRIRSRLVIYWLKALGIELEDSAYNVLAVGEIIHNASLLHDDVLDEADTRRGKQTLNKKSGSKISVLSGDYLLSLVFNKLQEINNSAVSTLFGNCMSEMIKGEMKQYFLRDKFPTEYEYLDICKKKTAELFRTMMESCLLVSGTKSEYAIDFAQIFGTYFQIKNDMELSSAETDRKNGIHTALDILGIEKTSNLLDNYEEEMREKLAVLSDSVYKAKLGDMIREL